MNSKFHFVVTLLSILSTLYTETNAQSPNWLWAKAMGGEFGVGYSIVIDPGGSGDVYTLGEFQGIVDFDPGPETYYLTSPGTTAIFISKLDKLGNFVWAKAIDAIAGGHGRPMAIDPTGNGDIYITGYFEETVDFDPGETTYNLTSAGGNDIFITKLNRDGQFVWTSVLGSPEDEEGYALQVDPSGNGNVYLTGSFESTISIDQGVDTFILNSKGRTDILIVKIDSTGQVLWSKSIGGTKDDNVYSLALDPSGSGDVFTTGFFGGTADFDPDSTTEFNLTAQLYGDIFISKLDSDGNYVWAKAITGFYGIGTSIAIDPGGSGDVYTFGAFGGTMDFDPGEGVHTLMGTACFISKLDQWGNFVWAKTFPIQDGDIGFSIALDPTGNGGIYTTGLFADTSDFDPGEGIFNLTAAGDQDIFISKLDYTGNFLWAQAIGGEAQDVGYSIAIDTTGNNEVLVTGGFISSEITFGSTTLMNPGVSFYIAKLEGMTTSLNNVQSNTLPISIYPNPVNTTLTIVLDKEYVDLNISISNTLGELVYLKSNQNISNEITIDMVTLAPGIYFIAIDLDGNRVVKKVVKE